MSRGGRGGGRGGARKNQPDFAWDDEETTPIFAANKPAPTFPPIHLPVPRPLSKSEVSSARHYLSFRARSHASPYFATLDSASLTDEKGKVSKRAGFDPFNDQESYSKKFQKKVRTVPEMGGREYNLEFFPKELWGLLDPKRKHPLWKTLDEGEQVKAKKVKRKRLQQGDEDGEKEAESGDESDAGAMGKKETKKAKTRKRDPTTKNASQKRGLDAEDDYPDDQEDEDGEGSDEPQDSEFDDDDDDEEGNDYNAEQYFEGGDDDEMGDDGGGDGGDEGGTF